MTHPISDIEELVVGRPLPILAVAEQDSLREELRDVIEYRKSRLSVNWIVGCPLDCGYCVRHLFDNYEMKLPRALMSDDEAAKLLVGHRSLANCAFARKLADELADPFLGGIARIFESNLRSDAATLIGSGGDIVIGLRMLSEAAALEMYCHRRRERGSPQNRRRRTRCSNSPQSVRMP